MKDFIKTIIICTIAGFLFLFISDKVFSYETHEEIDALTVDGMLRQLLNDVYPACYYTKIDEEGDYVLANIAWDDEEPECEVQYAVLEARLDQYKESEHNDLTYRTDLRNAKVEAKTKFLQVRPHFHSLLAKAGLPHISNPDAWLRDFAERKLTIDAVQGLIVKLDLMIAKIPEIQAEIAAQAAKEAAYNQALSYIKAYDCASITNNLNKAICVVLQGK
jgi:hypothetical protein